MQLGKHVLITRLAEQSTGGGTSINEAVDMYGFDGVYFLANIGTTGTAGTITIAHGASTTGFVDVTSGTQASTGGNDIVELDVYRPIKRYVRATLSTTANARMSLFAVRYCSRQLQSSTALGTLVSPTTT